MIPKKLVMASLLLVSLMIRGQAQQYPQRLGPVSDYAGKLDGAQVKELTDLIQDYERRTSIEFVVVIVDSLHGESAREYAMHVGDLWGVGQAGRNNGIVLLWAPLERAYSLRIADGLAHDLNDADARLITEQNLLPNFRREDYYMGLKETVLATMRKLGDESWEERLQVRSRAAAASGESDRWILWGTVGGVVILVSAIFVGIIVHQRRQRTRKLKEMEEVGPAIFESLRKARENAPKIQQILSDFKSQFPEQDAAVLTKDLEDQPRRIANIQTEAIRANFADLNSYDEVLRLEGEAGEESDLLGRIQDRIAEIKSCKKRSQARMEQLSKESFQIPELRDGSRRSEVDELLMQSRRSYEQARQNSSMSLVNWLIVDELLNRSQEHARKAVQASRAVPYVPSFSSSTSEGSTGSFFGGDSGSGGGGFSSGSGSDGTY